jgi:hypothetical protein
MADAVVFVASSASTLPEVERSIEQLRRADARLMGFVFSEAHPRRESHPATL